MKKSLISNSKILNKNHIKSLSLSSLGGTLEFYDFIIFVFFAPMISSLFFPSTLGTFWSMLNTYGAFAAGYFARPIGGIVMAHFGDKKGRKNMFMLSILLMVIPTFLLGLLPTYESIGYFAPIILVIVRILQGIAIGGELPGAWVFISEHIPRQNLGIGIGLLTASVVGGILLGSLVTLGINLYYTDSELIEYAWRFPFILGGIFGIIAIFLRRYLKETPVFKEMQESNKLSNLPIKDVIQSSKIQIFISILLTWILTGCVVILILIIPNFMQKIPDISKIDIQIIQMIGIFALSSGCVFCGFLDDRFSMSRNLQVLSIIFMITSFVFFYYLKEQNSISLIAISYIIDSFFAGVMMNFAPLAMVRLFPSKIRFSGVSFSYNISYALFGGLSPILALSLNNYDSMFLGYYFIFLGLMGALIGTYLHSKDLY